jgi:hypothetical protein
MSKHKQLKNNVIYIIITAVILTIVSFLVKPAKYEAYDILAVNEELEAMEKEPENSLDVLFVGNSECADVYAPVQLYGENGFTSYNAGSSGQHFADSYAILKEELKRQKPKLIVIETNSLFVDYDLYNTKNWLEILVQRVFPITHYHSFYKLAKLPELIPSRITETKTAASRKGYWARFKSKPYKGSTDYMNQNAVEQSIPVRNQRYLERVLELARDNQTSVMLVSSPSPKNWTKGMNLGVSDWAQQNGVYFLDLNEHLEDINIDWNTDSLDQGDHINHNGSKKVNAYLGKIIQQRYTLADHRSDKDYQSWTDLYNSTILYP